jgi:hypothetical protein
MVTMEMEEERALLGAFHAWLNDMRLKDITPIIFLTTQKRINACLAEL